MGVNDHCNPWIKSCSLATDKAVQKWKEIVSEVHLNKCYIFAQLVHGGRAAHPEYCRGLTPVAPSPIAIREECHTLKGKMPHVTPLEITKPEIESIINEFRVSIRNAVEAGFDGVEFHGANGYLIDQFLRSRTNHRTDQYGGSIPNRCRFLLELIDMAITILPASKIGLKISPVGRYQDMYDDNPQELTKYLLAELSKREILYVVMGEPEPFFPGENQMSNLSKFARPYFNGMIISDGHIPLDERHRRVEAKEADMANFGQLLWANPDLSERLRFGHPLSQPDFQYMYMGENKGYCDIPEFELKEQQIQ
jgi:N-ethylmaleimide reductase